MMIWVFVDFWIWTAFPLVQTKIIDFFRIRTSSRTGEETPSQGEKLAQKN